VSESRICCSMDHARCAKARCTDFKRIRHIAVFVHTTNSLRRAVHVHQCIVHHLAGRFWRVCSTQNLSCLTGRSYAICSTKSKSIYELSESIHESITWATHSSIQDGHDCRSCALQSTNSSRGFDFPLYKLVTKIRAELANNGQVSSTFDFQYRLLLIYRP